MIRNTKWLLQRLNAILTTPTKYSDILCRCFSSVWCVTPLLLLGQLELFFNDLTMKYTPEIGVGMSNWFLSERVLPRWQRLVAYMKAMDLLHRAMHVIVPAHRHGHRNGQQSGHILHLRFVCYRPGGCQGNMEQVVARWRHLVALWKPWTSFIGQWAQYCTVAPPWLSEWSAAEVLSFIIAAFFAWHNHS